MPFTPNLPQAQAATKTSRLSRLRASGRALREVFLIGVPALLALPSAGDVDPAGSLAGELTVQGWVRLIAVLAVVALLAVRRRLPLVAVAGIAVLVVVAGGAVWLASLVVLLSVVTRAQATDHPRGVVLAAGLLWLGYAVRIFFTAPVPQPPWSSLNGLITVAFAGVMLALVACVGLYRGARRQLIVSAQERVARAEADQQRAADLARQRERALIAREMHDVLAHRLSVLALHAGALEYRADVAGGGVAQAAGVVRRSAHEALQDLRQVLGVLRKDTQPASAPTSESATAPVPTSPAAPVGEVHPAATAGPDVAGGHTAGHDQEGLRPVPDLAQVGDLVEEALATGAQVSLQVDAELRAVPTALSRAGYRVAQEGLTNARKHAAGAPVWVKVAVTKGELTIKVRNAARPAVPAGVQGASGKTGSITSVTRSAPLAGADLDLPGSGAGLVGVDERAALLGGRAEHGKTPDGGYRLQVDLPLPQRAPDPGLDPGPGAGPGSGRAPDTPDGEAAPIPAGGPGQEGDVAGRSSSGQPTVQPSEPCKSARGGAQR